MQTTYELAVKELEFQRSVAASDMFRLLSMFLQLPREEMALGVLDGTLTADVLEISKELGFPDDSIKETKTKLEVIKERISGQKELFTEIRWEYTRLFNDPEKPVINIYESLFLFKAEEGDKVKPRLFVSPAALDAERCYRQAGLIRSKEVNEPGDHMATEMEFMAYLYLQKAKGLNENNEEKIVRINAQIKEFMEVHLRKWAIDFFECCTTLSKSDIYQTVGQIGSTFMRTILEE
jgi:TorA maturation chaperone TorD